jgi:hypothetical protein
MLDLCIFGVTKKLIKRANKLEKVSLQTLQIANILENYQAVTAAFRNAGISLVMDTDRTMRCSATPETSRRVMGLPGKRKQERGKKS